MTPDQIEHARSYALPADFSGASTHLAPATAVQLGKTLDYVKRLIARVDELKESLDTFGRHDNRCYASQTCSCEYQEIILRELTREAEDLDLY